MNQNENIFESRKKALINFENMKECIQGLYELSKIIIPPDSIYSQIAQDNIEALYENFIELMINEAGAKHFIEKLKRSEVDLDISLDSLSKKI
ncbi:MAG: hypothetical protein ACFFD5_04110 [Candidatus Thorarchaeota archaeon]